MLSAKFCAAVGGRGGQQEAEDGRQAIRGGVCLCVGKSRCKVGCSVQNSVQRWEAEEVGGQRKAEGGVQAVCASVCMWVVLFGSKICSVMGGAGGQQEADSGRQETDSGRLETDSGRQRLTAAGRD
jgi:hypothetical protein